MSLLEIIKAWMVLLPASVVVSVKTHICMIRLDINKWRYNSYIRKYKKTDNYKYHLKSIFILAKRELIGKEMTISFDKYKALLAKYNEILS